MLLGKLLPGELLLSELLLGQLRKLLGELLAELLGELLGELLLLLLLQLMQLLLLLLLLSSSLPLPPRRLLEGQRNSQKRARYIYVGMPINESRCTAPDVLHLMYCA